MKARKEDVELVGSHTLCKMTPPKQLPVIELLLTLVTSRTI